ncbi:unnamed protein product, partial [Discosporangium mesarthrocarpum]
KAHLLDLVDSTLADLEDAGCLNLEADGDTSIISPTGLAGVASRYYLDYRTVALFRDRLGMVPVANEGGGSGLGLDQGSIPGLCRLLADAQEFAELPVRHNEDGLNRDLAKSLPWQLAGEEELDSPHAKAFLLLQAHFDRCPLPISDYETDTRGVLDQASRVLNAAVDVAAGYGLLWGCLGLVRVSQMLVQVNTE